MSTIYRGFMTTLWLTLQASEELGILSGDYIQDYFGNDGQVSLYHVATDAYYPVVIVEVPETTPEIPHDVFTGSYSLDLLPDGDYEIRGRVRDVVSNYTILNTVQTPLGSEDVQPMTLTIKSGFATQYVIAKGGLKLRTGIYTGAVLGMPGTAKSLSFGMGVNA